MCLPRKISIHAPARGATLSPLDRGLIRPDFNPRSREGSDRILRGMAFDLHNFNPRSREGSDGWQTWDGNKYYIFQSTLPRGERPLLDRHTLELSNISIHAPARGATLCQLFHVCTDKRISIHAPARGATIPLLFLFFPSMHFNPRSREGSDITSVKTKPMLKKFQSTLPRGERPSTWCKASLIITDFNPRSREGSDASIQKRISLNKMISIHAPARGATSLCLPAVLRIQISIHAPARGATNLKATAPRQVRISIHAPARGATAATPRNNLTTLPFQSTLPRGERRILSILLIIAEHFNPRSREGSDMIFCKVYHNAYISIHAPARGATMLLCSVSIWLLKFQSTLPRGERLIPGCIKISKSSISIHAPARGATRDCR